MFGANPPTHVKLHLDVPEHIAQDEGILDQSYSGGNLILAQSATLQLPKSLITAT